MQFDATAFQGYLTSPTFFVAALFGDLFLFEKMAKGPDSEWFSAVHVWFDRRCSWPCWQNFQLGSCGAAEAAAAAAQGLLFPTAG